MASRFYKYDKDKKKIVEFTPSSKNEGIYIGKNPWARTTKVEFSQTTMDQDIAERNKR